MACFLVPMTEAIVTTVAKKVIEKKEQKAGAEKVTSEAGYTLEKTPFSKKLGWLNKLLGIAMTFCIFALLISVVVYFVDSANNLLDFIPKEKLEESRFYPLLLDLSKEVFPHFKELFQQANI